MSAELRERIVEVGKHLHVRNLLAGADGNISVRISDEEILITPSGRNKAFLRASDIATVTLDNRVLEGNPSNERLMHLEIYRASKEARAVVHAHPPTAVAWSVAKPDLRELPRESLSEVILAVGRVPIARYAEPGTVDMGRVLHELLPESRVMILARHGGVSWGEDLEEAVNGMERIEHIAQILKSANELGGLTSLPAHALSRLYELRARMGNRTR